MGRGEGQIGQSCSGLCGRGCPCRLGGVVSLSSPGKAQSAKALEGLHWAGLRRASGGRRRNGALVWGTQDIGIGEFRPPGPQARESLRGQPCPAASAGPTAHALPAGPVRRPRTPGFPATGLSHLPSPGEPGAPRAPSLCNPSVLPTPRHPSPALSSLGRTRLG